MTIKSHIILLQIYYLTHFIKRRKKNLKFISLFMLSREYSKNPWHSVKHYFNNDSIHAIIEIPRGSKAKYELDKESGLLKLDRVLFSAVHYPANYGV